MPASNTVVPLRVPVIGSNVWVDVIVGQAQHGEYRVRLFDQSGRNPQEVGSGNNFDTLPDSFQLDTAAPGLANRLLGWRITIGSPEKPNGQMYYARVIVRQDSVSLSDEPIEYGPAELNGAMIFLGFAKFSV